MWMLDWNGEVEHPAVQLATSSVIMVFRAVQQSRVWTLDVWDTRVHEYGKARRGVTLSGCVT
eukprot:scaffold422124_cov18-Prasinocladus_malaysianus.AAC.1